MTKFFTSTIGKKLIMGISGLALYVFIIGHMAGNLNELRGQEAMNAYAFGLQSLGGLLWLVRGGVLTMALLHIWAAASLTMGNKQARPTAYAVNKSPGASLASRTMIWSGAVVLAFLVYHLLHFTLGRTDPTAFALHDAAGRHDVYQMVIAGFQNPVLAVSYMVAVGLLCWHLSHGVSSFFRSLGLMNKRWRGAEEKLAIGSAVLIFLGFSSVPVSVLLGLVK